MNSPTLHAPRSTLRDLVPLSDGRPGLRTTMQVEIREPSDHAPVAPKPGEGGSRMNPEGFRGTHHPPADAAASDVGDNSCNPCLDFISSDATLDRYGEIISAAGWELESYHRNPVFQNAHQYGDIIFTLGRALITEIRPGRTSSASPHLFQRSQFATEVNPMAKIAYVLYSGKF